MYVVIVYSSNDYKVYGPFDSEIEAIEWAKDFNEFAKWVVRPVEART